MTPPPNKLSRLITPAAILIAGLALGTFFADAIRPAAAIAQQANLDSPFNATEQRKQMIAQLTAMNDRLGKIETKLNTGISVKVTEMPPVVMKDPAAK